MATRKELRPLDEAIVHILRTAVESSGMTHNAIAGTIGVSQNRISKALRGETPPLTVGEVWAIAGALGLDPLEVLAEAHARTEVPLAPVTRLPLREDIEVTDELLARSAASIRPGDVEDDTPPLD